MGNLIANGERVRLLYLSASPVGGPPEQEINPDVDQDAIRDAIAEGGARERFDVRHVAQVRPSDLVQHLATWKPHIVHFSGHGLRGKGLIFTNDLGEPEVAHEAGLRCVFSAVPVPPCLVVLMTCYGHRLACALTPYVRLAALGIQDAIDDANATAFNKAFYRALAAGDSLRSAHALGTGVLRTMDVAPSGRPILELAPHADPDLALVPKPAALRKPRGSTQARPRARARV